MKIEYVINGTDSFMLEQSHENNQVNLSACPDHYVLRPFGENELEVIETTGNSPLLVPFFIVFSDETVLKTHRNKCFQYQSTGVARMKDGTIIDGVQYKFKYTYIKM